MAVRRQVPKTGLPLAVPAHLIAGFAEAAVEAQVVSDGVLPAVRSRLEEGEVLSAKENTSLLTWGSFGNKQEEEEDGADLVKW